MLVPMTCSWDRFKDKQKEGSERRAFLGESQAREREREEAEDRTAMVCDDAVQISKGNCQNQNDHTG